MKLRLSGKWRRLLILPPIVAGAAWLGYQASHRSLPERAEAREAGRTLRVVRVPEVAAMPRAVGYGVAEPGRTWRAVAEVKGRIVELHPELRSGAFAREGDLLARLDATDYELQVAKLEAGIAQLEAERDEIDAREANLRATLAIEERSLELSRTELGRLEQLAASEDVSASVLDQERRTVLVQEKAVVSVESSLRLLPSERASLEADLRANEASLETARRDLERTRLIAPFDCRLSEAGAELGQFVAAGEVLAEAQGLDSTEVEAQFPVERIRNFVADAHNERDGATTTTPLDALGEVAAVVRFQAGEHTISWDARVLRARELLDPDTRTIGFVVGVERPYDNAIPGVRPPLVKGMFCEVELRRAPVRAYPVVPRLALHSDRSGSFVYLRDEEGRLARRDVVVAFAAGGFAAVASGLQPGEELVVSDPTPAVLGMRVEPVEDAAVLARLVREATGEDALR